MPQRGLAEIKAEQNTLRTRIGQLVDEAREIEIKLSVDGANDGLEERKANIERGKAEASARLEELATEYRAELQRRIESGTVTLESGADLEDPRASSGTNDAPNLEPQRRQALDGALRTLERSKRGEIMTERAATRMERLVRHSDATGVTARYLMIADVATDADTDSAKPVWRFDLDRPTGQAYIWIP
jgi:hypothetical protein